MKKHSKYYYTKKKHSTKKKKPERVYHERLVDGFWIYLEKQIGKFVGRVLKKLFGPKNS